MTPWLSPARMQMNTDYALKFLKEHQPMPSDNSISHDEGKTFTALLQHFELNPDSRCIPLLINSVSKGTGLGMYEHIKFVLLAHKKEDVLPHIKDGLLNGNVGVKYRCCWWAADIAAWDFYDIIEPLTQHKDEDIRDAARSFIELKEELA